MKVSVETYRKMIKGLKKDFKMSQKSIAEELGEDKQTISNIMNERIKVNRSSYKAYRA